MDYNPNYNIQNHLYNCIIWQILQVNKIKDKPK